MPIAPIVIDGELTIERVAELKSQFDTTLQAARSGDCIVLDMTGLYNLDGAGLQLLLGFSRALASLDARLSMQGTPESSLSLLAEYDLLERFSQAKPVSLS